MAVAGGDGEADGGNGGAVVMAAAAAGEAVAVIRKSQDEPDFGRFHTCLGSCNPFAVAQGYFCSSTDFLRLGCLQRRRRGAGGSLPYFRSTDTVHEPGSGDVTEVALFQTRPASGASLRSPRPDRTGGVRPTGSHNPCCSGGGCAGGGKGQMVGWKQAHWTRQ